MTEIWLDIQTGFAIFVGPVITFGLAMAVAGAIAETFIGAVYKPTQKVEINRQIDNE